MSKEELHMRQQILQVARAEFIANGFQEASLRQIAKTIGISVSNIYNHYKNKDDLFVAVVQPLLDMIEERNMQHNSDENLSLTLFSDNNYMKRESDSYLRLIMDYRSEFNLLFFQSDGSSLADFRSMMINRYAIHGCEYMKLMKRRYPEVNCDISPLFMRINGASFMAMIGEIILDDTLTDEEIKLAIDEYMIFGVNGWKALMNVK